MASPEQIIHADGDPDAWVCLCGNTPAADGFFPCDEHGTEVEPTPEAWTSGSYVCARCGRIIKQDSLAVAGRAVQQKPQ